MIITGYRYLMGYVQIQISEGFLERFLNLIGQRQIRLWDIKKEQGTVIAYALYKDYKKMGELAEKTGVNLSVIGKHGMGFRTKPYQKRWGVLAGFLLVLGLFFFSSNIVFTIDVSGNKTVEKEEILSVLKEEGFTIGCMTKKLDLKMIEQKALLKLPQFSWLAINVKGVNAVIDVKERIIPPVIESEEGDADIISKKDAVITKTQVYGGKTLVNIGDVVLQGQLLVSGTAERRTGDLVYQKAVGKVFGNVNEKQSFTVEKQQVQTKEKDKKENYIFEVFGFKIPIIQMKEIPEGSDVEVVKEPFTFFSIGLPVIKYTQKIITYEEEKKELTEEEMKEELEKKMVEYERGKLPNSILVEKEITEIIGENQITYEVQYIFEEDIAEIILK